MVSNIGTIISLSAMYIKISSLIFDYILPIKFFCLSDCKKDDKPLHKVEETSSFQIFSNNATVSNLILKRSYSSAKKMEIYLKLLENLSSQGIQSGNILI